MSRTSQATEHSSSVRDYALEQEYLTRRELVEPGGNIISLPWPLNRPVPSSPARTIISFSSSDQSSTHSLSPVTQSQGTGGDADRVPPIRTSPTSLEDRSSPASSVPGAGVPASGVPTATTGSLSTLSNTPDPDVLFIGEYRPVLQRVSPAVKSDPFPSTPIDYTIKNLPSTSGFQNQDFGGRNIHVQPSSTPPVTSELLWKRFSPPQALVPNFPITGLSTSSSNVRTLLNHSPTSSAFAKVLASSSQESSGTEIQTTVITGEMANQIVQAVPPVPETHTVTPNQPTGLNEDGAGTSQEVKGISLTVSGETNPAARGGTARRGRPPGRGRGHANSATRGRGSTNCTNRGRGRAKCEKRGRGNANRAKPGRGRPPKVGDSKSALLRAPDELVKSIKELIRDWDPNNELTGSIQIRF